MSKLLKLSVLGALSAVIFIACETRSVGVQTAEALPRDKARGVLSFADALEPVLPSIVRIGRLKTNAEGRILLSGIGSGAVIDNDNGYVITNAHVVAGGEKFVVNMPDGRILEAKLIGMDTPTDIAVLQTDDLRAAAVPYANSDNLRIGDVVFAVGYPLGLEQSLSFGVVSGLGRSSSQSRLQDFIQTDAAINSGNSGGPLLDSRGWLVGINTAIVTRSGGSNGIGFSVPINMAKQVSDQLVKYGEVRRGSIGVSAGRVSEEISEKVGINHWDGAHITEIDPQGSAAKAGLQVGDVITHLDGKKVKNPSSLRAWLGVTERDTQHSLTYVRQNGVANKISITSRNTQAALITDIEQLGAHVRQIRPTDNIPSDIKGAYVSRIDEGTPAQRSGLMVGDVICGVNNQETHTLKEHARLILESGGRARLLVYRLGVVVPIIVEP